MTSDMKDLLLFIRQHRAFPELLTAVEVPTVKPFRQSNDPQRQHTDWIFNSGRAKENELWRQFLIGNSDEADPSNEESK